MIEYLKPAISSLSSAKEIISSLLAIRDFTKYAPDLNKLLSDVIKANEMIITIQERESSLTAKINELRKECMRLKEWNAEKGHYERRQVGNGVFVYIDKNYVGMAQGAHKLCCNCFDKNIKSTLQQSIGGRMLSLICPNGCPKIVFEYYIR